MTATLPACSVHDLIEVAQEDSNTVRADGVEVSPGRSEPAEPEPEPEPAGTAESIDPVGKSDGPSDETSVATNDVLQEVGKSRQADPAGDPDRVFVPGYGWVSWSDPLLDAQARYLSLIHRPAPQQARYRLRWRVVPQRVAETMRCRFCGQEWLCAEAAWAASRLAFSARQRGGGGRRIAGKHRARLIDRLKLRHTSAVSLVGPARRLEPAPEL